MVVCAPLPPPFLIKVLGHCLLLCVYVTARLGTRCARRASSRLGLFIA